MDDRISPFRVHPLWSVRNTFCGIQYHGPYQVNGNTHESAAGSVGYRPTRFRRQSPCLLKFLGDGMNEGSAIRREPR